MVSGIDDSTLLLMQRKERNNDKITICDEIEAGFRNRYDAESN